MLIHLCPSLFAYGCDDTMQLMDIRSDELGLSLRDGIEITARRPCPNKNYLMACRKSGQKAVYGFLVDVPGWLAAFTVVTRWISVAGDHVATHRVHYEVLDSSCGAVSEHMALWYGYSDRRGNSHACRIPADYPLGAPIAQQPRMEVFPRLERVADSHDVYDGKGRIVERVETFRMPSIDLDRLTDPQSCDGRMPLPESAFVAGHSSSMSRMLALGVVGESQERR